MKNYRSGFHPDGREASSWHGMDGKLSIVRSSASPSSAGQGVRNDDLHQSGAVVEMDKKKKFCVFFVDKESR